MATISKPIDGEFAPYASTYISKVPETDLAVFCAGQETQFLAELRAISEAQSFFRYAPGKWSLKETLGHISDAERAFSYRLLRIARGDTTPLPPFEQDAWVLGSRCDERPWDDLISEFAAVRKATLALIHPLNEAEWSRMGTVSGYPVSARALGYIVAGHVEHHRHILRTFPPPAV
ncbi:MAG: DinB family protein [Bryobacterales bacterium]|nr:DinB family protein [Bryobacterales bacterium]